MTANDNLSNPNIARDFNDATKLQYINLNNKPPLYKIYPDLRAIPLPAVAEQPGPAMPTLDAIRGDSPGTNPLTLENLASLLYHSAAVIKRAQLRDGEVHYRAAASAGALYPTEVYVVCGDLDGLRAGVYHFNPRDFTLARLRNGDLRRWLGAALGNHTAYPATLVFTTVFWRSAWKYRERGYRYCYWDLGTVAANLLASGNAEGVPVALRCGFVDRSVSGFLGLDGLNEAPSMLASWERRTGSCRPVPATCPEYFRKPAMTFKPARSNTRCRASCIPHQHYGRAKTRRSGMPPTGQRQTLGGMNWTGREKGSGRCAPEPTAIFRRGSTLTPTRPPPWVNASAPEGLRVDLALNPYRGRHFVVLSTRRRMVWTKRAFTAALARCSTCTS